MLGNPCVIVHAGAGYHSKLKETAYNKLCDSACKVAAELLSDSSKSAVEAASAAVAHLEDSLLTNAGTGSNLTYGGLVECDAGIMCGLSLRFAGIGSVRRIRNPILAAELLLQEQLNNPRTALGRVQPCVLFGDGAREWVIAKDPSRFTDCDLVSDKARSDWLKYRQWLQDAKHCNVNEETKQNHLMHTKRRRDVDENTGLDTVGAICVDKYGNIAAAVSSGGIALKHEGRIGQSCIYGCGCWAEKDCESAVGVATSGTGEQLIRTQLAQRTAEAILSNSADSTPDVLQSVMRDKFLGSRFLTQDEHRYAGIAGIHCFSHESHRTMEIFYAHTTRSMSIGYYIQGTMAGPVTLVSRKSPDQLFRLEVFSRRSNIHFVHL